MVTLTCFRLAPLGVFRVERLFNRLGDVNAITVARQIRARYPANLDQSPFALTTSNDHVERNTMHAGAFPPRASSDRASIRPSPSNRLFI